MERYILLDDFTPTIPGFLEQRGTGYAVNTPCGWRNCKADEIILVTESGEYWNAKKQTIENKFKLVSGFLEPKQS